MIRKKKLDDDIHIEASREEEPPPPPPPGMISLSETVKVSIDDTAALWPEVSPERQVIIVPLAVADEFLAFGIFPPVDDPTYTCRAPFVARGLVSQHREGFIARMTAQGVKVELHAEPPLESQRQYLIKYFSGSAGPSSLKVAA